MSFLFLFARKKLTDTTFPGELVAMHRKVHLFDIDIPGKITFKVCSISRQSLSYRWQTQLIEITGKRDAYGRKHVELLRYG